MANMRRTILCGIEKKPITRQAAGNRKSRHAKIKKES